MIKAREDFGLNDAKVKGRFLFITMKDMTLKVFPSILINLKPNVIYLQAYVPGGGGGYSLIRGYWGCAAGWGRVFRAELTIMGLHF